MKHITLRRAVLFSSLLACLVFANALRNGFAYDDVHILVDNENIHSMETFTEAVTTPYWPIREGPGLGLWRPFATAVYALGWNAFDGSPLPFHLLNILLHGVVTALTVLLITTLTASPLAGLFGGVVFAMHPVHVEVVANIIGFAELWSAVTYLSACLLFIRWRSTGFGLGRSAVIAGLFAWGLLTKESAVTLPAALFLMDCWYEDFSLRDVPRMLKERALVYGSIIVAAVVVFLGRHEVLGSIANSYPALGADLLDEIPRIWTLGEVWLHYVRLLVFPLDLAADYSPRVVNLHLGWNATNTAGALLTLFTLILAAVSWRQKKGRAFAAGVVWFVITMSPVSNFFFMSGVLLGERLLYLPSVGFSLALGWLVVLALPARRRLTLAALTIWVVGFSVRTWTRTPTWESTETVFFTLMNEHLEAGRAQWVAGDSHWQEGQVSAALRNYRYAIGSVGAGYTLLSEITRKLLGMEKYAQAETLARMLWEDEPKWDAGPAYLAVALENQGEIEEALEWAQIAKGIDPEVSITRHMLSNLYRELERYPEAIAEREAAIELGEGEHWQQWMWLAELRQADGQHEAALQALDSARVREPEEEGGIQIDSLAAVLRGASGVASPLDR